MAAADQSKPASAPAAPATEPTPFTHPPPVPYPHFNVNGVPYPGAYPGFYTYPPPPETVNGETNPSAPGGPPPGYMMFAHPPPPGMVFAFPPPPPPSAPAPTPQNSSYTPPSSQAAPPPPPPPPPSAPPSGIRPKRKQVKMACTNCAQACKRCDDHRPCERCLKYGIAETCVDGQRKERKKGIKRGPYKRKTKSVDETTPQFTGEGGEWPAATAPPATTSATTAAAIQAVAHQFPNGEAFYHPIYYPPHGAPFLAAPPHPHEGSEGAVHPPVPYYITGAYPPPFGHYAPFLHAPPPTVQAAVAAAAAAAAAAQTVDPVATNANSNGDIKAGGTANGDKVNGYSKKRAREPKGDTGRTKKAKHQQLSKEQQQSQPEQRAKSPKEAGAAEPNSNDNNTAAAAAAAPAPPQASTVVKDSVKDYEPAETGTVAEEAEVEAQVEVAEATNN